MKWEENLYTLNRKGLLAPQNLEVLLLLPQLRDEVFFPDYHDLGYAANETLYAAVNEELNVYNIDISLRASVIQRKLNLAFVFEPGKDLNNSFIFDRIYRTDAANLPGNAVDMHILVAQRTEKSVDINYARLSRYSGDTQSRIRKSLEQIRYNYDHFAADIISGENWVTNAEESYEQLN